MRTLINAALCCIAVATVFGQRGPTPYYEDTNNIPVSPEVHADRTVTFRLFAPKASEVVLMGSPGILEFTKKPLPLQKDEKGIWSLTIGASRRLLHVRIRDRRRSPHARSVEPEPGGAALGRHQHVHRAEPRKSGL